MSERNKMRQKMKTQLPTCATSRVSWTLFLLCAGLCPACLCHAADPPAAPGEIAGAKASVTIPFHLSYDLIHVDVKLNGKGPFDFILDCGSSGPTLSPALARQVGLPIQGQASGRDEELQEQGSMATVQRVDLGGAYYVPEPFYCFDEPEPNTLGYDVFRRYVVTIDYARRRLTLTRPECFHYHGEGTVVPCRFLRTHPVVNGSVDGIPAAFTVDTGNSGYLNFRTTFIENHHLQSRMHTIALTTHGMDGKTQTDRIARFQIVRLGRVVLHEMLGDIGRDRVPPSSNPGIACNIGTSALEQFTVTFDYRRSRLIFEKNVLWGQHDLFSRSGLFVSTRKPVWQVVEILPHSPADQAGMTVGDTVLAVNGKRHGQLPPFLVRNIIGGAIGSRRLFLTVQTKSGIRTVVLALGGDLL